MSLRVVMIALLILTAVALGLIAFQIGGVQRPTAGLTPRIETLPPAPAQTVTYLVSARPLPAGTLPDPKTSRYVP